MSKPVTIMSDDASATEAPQVSPRFAGLPLSTRRSGRRGGNSLRRFPGVAPISVLVLIFLYVPMVFVVVFSFNKGQQALLWRGFSLRWFAKVFTDSSIISATLVSLEVASIAMVLSTILGVAFVLAADNMSRAGSRLATALINASLIIPEVVLGISTMAFIRLLGMSPGFVPLILAHTTFCIPFVVMPVRARLQTIDQSCFEAAVDLGATRMRTVMRVTLPLLTPAIISGALMAFVISMDDFMISNFLTAAGTTTLPIYIFSLIRKGVNPSINVVATLLLLMAVVVTVVSTLLTNGRRRKS
ncbi:binding-protein dependent transport system inner membrane protein [Bifidobacterium minimum]|uniref:Spermidine/putrescine transport system permease protein PotC n=1 Tax=Bifidobacterium minimum TaxID=1693 RepID=A0A087BMG4_9BIFI|nr:ABC transporter permease [Bifidobacterium minimum]KFI72214.1 binding-protein dependent transport system inner membrane protein [Bifidobacterium minimum]MCH4158635.1 ABC transporter permease [Bifidobacterium minimum]